MVLQYPPQAECRIDVSCHTGGATTPVEVRRKGLRSMRRLLPRMQLAGYASAVLHPLIRVVDGPTVRCCETPNKSLMASLMVVARMAG